MLQWMERQRKKWEETVRGMDKGVKGQKTRGRVGNKMEEGEWGWETGRRPNSNGSTNGEEKRGKGGPSGSEERLGTTVQLGSNQE